MYSPQQSPDWIMLGMPQGDEFAIYASKDLTQAQLETQVINERDLYGDLGGSPYYQRTSQPAIYEHTISATMLTFVKVNAPTYADALRTLLTQWNPEARREASVNPMVSTVERVAIEP